MADEMEKRLCGILEQLYAADAGPGDSQALAQDALRFMRGETGALQRDIRVRAVKGGVYKIKEYYLENNELSDIRGASAVITEVQERIVPDLLWQLIGFDGVIYNGGGNMLALIPADLPGEIGDIGETLEQAAERCMLTANVAYICTEPFPISELLGAGYRKCAARIELMLTERKKARAVCDICPQSEMNHAQLCGVTLALNRIEVSGAMCSRCCKRIASYAVGEAAMCGGCAHKYSVGRVHRQRFLSEYQSYLRQNRFGFAGSVVSPQNYEEIDESHIAVVYADGNNMGGLIQNIRCITDMMDFSQFVKETMPRLVFRAMAVCGVQRFELVAVGGDDIFILLPAVKAVSFSRELIALYKSAFDAHFAGNRSTLSVGICIAKPSDKVKVMLEAAEGRLKKAKSQMRLPENAAGSGSLSFTVMGSYEGVSAGYAKRRSMLPYTYEQLLPVLAFVKKWQPHKITTRIRNIADAYANAESPEEMRIFFRYVNAKETTPEKRIVLPEIPGYKRCDGYYENDAGEDSAFWEDIIDLMKFYDPTTVREGAAPCRSEPIG